jgi:hypothetical protein
MTKYEAQVTIEVDVDGDEEVAFAAVDEIMQRAWDTDQGRAWQTQKWHYAMHGIGYVTKVISPEEAREDAREEDAAADVYEENR